MRFHLLGSVELHGRTGAMAVRGHRPALLLSVLALRASQLVRTESLLQEVWPDGPPANARNALQAHVSYLRKVLREVGLGEPIRTREGGYQLEAVADETDVHAFRTHLRRAQRAGADDPATVLVETDRALEIWPNAHAGPAFDTTHPITQSLHRERAELQLLRLEALLATGRFEDAHNDAVVLATERPLDERAHRVSIRALARTGRYAEALEAHDRFRIRLRDELGVDPDPETDDVFRRILQHQLPDEPLPRAAHPTVVARNDELHQVRVLLSKHRMVTITGPGGVGKSALASVLRREFVDDGRDVWTAVVGSSTTALGVLSRAVGVEPGDDPVGAVVARLRDCDGVLLIEEPELDLEGTVRACQAVLAATQDVRVLITSRAALPLSDGPVFRLQPLLAPGREDGSDPARLRRFGAVRLFLDEASRVSPGFELDPVNGPDVALLCRASGGLPLAVKLVAAQLRMRPLEQIVSVLETARVVEAVPAVVPLPTIVDRSLAPLPEPDQRTFRRLAVFDGAFSADVAGEVAGRPDVADQLQRLADASLLEHVASPVAARFRMHPVVRSQTLEQLEASRDLDGARRRRALALARWCLSNEAELRGPDQVAWVREFAASYDDIVSGVRWAVEHDEAQLLAEYVVGTSWYIGSVDMAQTRGWCERLAGRWEEVAPPMRARAAAWAVCVDSVGAPARDVILGWADASADPAARLWARLMTSLEPGAPERPDLRARFAELARLSEELGDEWMLGRARYGDALADIEAMHLDRAADAAVEARHHLASLEDVASIALVDEVLGLLALARWRWGDAEQRAEAALGVARATQDLELEASCLHLMGTAARGTGRQTAARRLGAEAFRTAMRVGSVGVAAQAGEGFAAALAADHPAQAVRVLGAVERFRTSHGLVRNPLERALNQPEFDRLAHDLGQGQLASLQQGGDVLEDLIDVWDAAPETHHGPDPGRAAGLPRR